MNSSKREIMKENFNDTLKTTTASEPYSKRVNDIERENKSVSEHKKDTIIEITSIDQFDKMHLSQDECEESKHEIKNLKKINNEIMVGKRMRPFCDIIGKQEQRREELEKIEGDLRKRLDMLECSIPAVMVWNILKMSQGASVCSMGRILEKQFKDARELSCRSTPSCHYDCRVREVEAERKLALKKTEEARTLWLEKLATLEKRKIKLEEAKRIQEEQKNAMERLNEEVKALREKTEKKTVETNESCQYDECDDTRCKLGKVSSMTSIESEDIQCLEKLQQLAEDEVIIKRGIAELERREEAYMRTLQQTDELWSKMEGDTISKTNALQEQLDMKITANQQLADRVCELEDSLEKCRARMAACRTELEKFLSIEKIEATIGRDDDVAKVTDKAVAVKVKVIHRLVGRVDDVATVEDDEVLARVKVVDEETLARIVLIDADAEVAIVKDDKYVSVKPDSTDLAVDRPMDLVQIADAESIIRPEDFAYEQQKFKKIQEYLAKLGSLEELYKDGEPCAPDFVCNDVVTSPTGMTDEELITLDEDPSKKFDEKLVACEEEREKQFREKLAKEANHVVDDIEKKEKKPDKISDIEIETRLVTEAKEEITKAIDVSLEEIVTDRTIQEIVDDKPVTMPSDVKALKVKKIETDQAIIIKRDTILSWIDMIDTIRTSAAKHSNCHIVKKDADTLVEQVCSYVGTEPKKVGKITTEDKWEKVIEKNKIKIKKEIITKTKLQDKLIVSTNGKMKTESISSISSPRPEETSIEVKDPMEPVAELLPTLTKEEISIGMESSAVSIENSFQFPTIPVKENLKSVTVPTTEPVPYKTEIEKTEIEKETQVKEIVYDTKEDEISQINKIEEKVVFEDQKVKKKEGEIISEKIPQVEKIKVTDLEETRNGKIIETKISKVSLVINITEIEQNIEETLPVTDVKDITKIIPEIVSPTADLIETEKIESSESPIADVEKPSSVNAKKELLILNAITEKKVEEPSITDVMQKEIKIEEVPTITDIIKGIEAKESIEEITEKKIEIPQVTEQIMQKEIKEIEKIEEMKMTEQPVSEAEIEKEKDEEIEKIPEKVTPSIKLFKEREEEEISSVKKEKISMKITLPAKPIIEGEKEKKPIDEKKLELVELKIPIAEVKPPEIEVPVIPIDSRLLTLPYLIIAKIKEKELLQVAPAIKLPCEECCLQPPLAKTAKPVEIMQTNVAQTEIVQTKVVQTEIVENEIVETEIVKTGIVEITTQTISIAEPSPTSPIRIISEDLKPAELKTSPSIKIVGDPPEITGRKMFSPKRLKDQSTVTTASTGSQTDKASHVSHDRVVRDERERARVTTDELLRSIKIAVGLARPNAEREIRTINYGKSDEKMACNCCQCGKILASSSTIPDDRLKVRPQIDAKTAMPPAVTAFKRIFIPPKTDHPISYDRLCPNCKAKIQRRIVRSNDLQEKYHIEKISREEESCDCPSSIDKSYRAIFRKKEIEKKDQGCLAKIPKRKNDFVLRQKKKDDLQSILEEKFDVKPLSPSCICYKLEKTSVEPIKKGNCYCGD